MNPKLTRRGILKGAAAIGGAAAGARLGGKEWIGEAQAATEPAHLVHIFFNGGLNALFSGQADKLAGVFNSGGTPKAIGDGIFTDADTFGTLPQFALDHWAAIGMRHGSALHTTPQNLNSGGERAILTNQSGCYLNQLAHAMGGDSPQKACYFGDRAPAYRDQPAFEGVPLERIRNLKDALTTYGAAVTPNPDAPERAMSASSIETSESISSRNIAANPTRLAGLGDAYKSAVGALRKPPPKPVTLGELQEAYGLGTAETVGSYASMLAGAELMIRAAGTNVINVCDFGLASYDFHQLQGGQSLNVFYSRRKLLGQGGFTGSRIAPIRTFMNRMLNSPDRNVVVVISGELVRLTNGDHGDGTVAAMFGKYVKRGVSFGVNNQSRFAATTPPVRAFWAAAAAALKVPGTPFDANPHPVIL